MSRSYFRQLKLPLEIKKSNALARAEIRVKNNPLANKIFAALVRAINPAIYPEVPEIDIATLLPLRSCDGGRDYKLIEEACNILMEAKVELTNGIKNPKTGHFILMSIVSTLEYNRGLIKAKFHPDLGSHLLDLQQFYTKLNFFELASLKGFYTPRIYEVLKSWEKGTDSYMVEIPLEGKGGLYHSLSFPKALQNNFKNIRLILEKGHKEIHAKTGLKYSWEPIKRSRKVVAILFYFGGERQKAQLAKSYPRKKRSIKEQSRKNNTLANVVLACMKERGIAEGKGQLCPAERPTLSQCKLCSRWREPSLLSSEVSSPGPG